jgi:hypothetical protein
MIFLRQSLWILNNITLKQVEEIGNIIQYQMLVLRFLRIWLFSQGDVIIEKFP